MAEKTEHDAPVMVDILEALNSSDPVSIPLLYRLSDLTPAELGEFCCGWATIDAERRRVIVRHLADIIEENFHVDFTGVFEHCLEDIAPEVRKASLDGLWDSDKVTLIRPIIDLMESDPDNEVRALAAATLGHYILLGEWGQIRAGAVEPVVESLLKQIDDEQTADIVKYAALESVAASGHPRIESLIHDAYDSADLEAQKSALFAMGRSAETRWINTVIDEMSSPIVEMRLEAARAAGEIGDKSAVPEVIELTSDEDLEVRLIAVTALGRLGGHIPRRFLEDIIADPDRIELHEVASEALEEVDWLGGAIDL
ncbi:MAG: HEAT repeat domain-containing protein [Candidatus Promineifilaceae bacterium]